MNCYANDKVRNTAAAHIAVEPKVPKYMTSTMALQTQPRGSAWIFVNVNGLQAPSGSNS